IASSPTASARRCLAVRSSSGPLGLASASTAVLKAAPATGSSTPSTRYRPSDIWLQWKRRRVKFSSASLKKPSGSASWRAAVQSLRRWKTDHSRACPSISSSLKSLAFSPNWSRRWQSTEVDCYEISPDPSAAATLGSDSSCSPTQSRSADELIDMPQVRAIQEAALMLPPTRCSPAIWDLRAFVENRPSRESMTTRSSLLSTGSSQARSSHTAARNLSRGVPPSPNMQISYQTHVRMSSTSLRFPPLQARHQHPLPSPFSHSYTASRDHRLPRNRLQQRRRSGPQLLQRSLRLRFRR